MWNVLPLFETQVEKMHLKCKLHNLRSDCSCQKYIFIISVSQWLLFTARQDLLCVNKIILLSSEPHHSSEIANQPHHSVLSVDLNKVIIFFFLLIADGKFSHLCMTGKLHRGQGQAELGFHDCYDRKPPHEKNQSLNLPQMYSLMRACTICF